jgi:regulatory factor X 1/2/3
MKTEVTVTCDVNRTMDAGDYEDGGSTGPNQTAATHYTTTTATGPHPEVTTLEIVPIYVQDGEDSGYKDMCDVNGEEILHPVYTVVQIGTADTTDDDEHCSGDTTTPTYTKLEHFPEQGVSVGHLLAEDNGAYIKQEELDPDLSQAVVADVGVEITGNDSADHSSLRNNRYSNIQHTFCTVKATDEWLRRNYEEAPGMAIPRSTIQSHYLRYCKENNLHPTNAATLGRRIREIFRGVESKRPGKRGKSKYHYCGIRVNHRSSIQQFLEEGDSAVHQQPSTQLLCNLPSSSGGSESVTQNTGNGYDKHSSNESNSSSQHHHRQCLGDASAAIPDFPGIEFPPGCPIPVDCTVGDVKIFHSIYRQHCELFLNAVVNLGFQGVQSLWKEFWRGPDNNSGDKHEEGKQLSKIKLYQLCNSGPVQRFVWHVDCLVYNNVLEVLFPDVLRPVPLSVTQAISNFADNLQLWLTEAMKGCPEKIYNIKMSTVNALAQMLRRYSSLNRLSRAARTMLQKSSQIDHMLDDLIRVDFSSVREQASWVCQYDNIMVQQLEAHYINTLYALKCLDQWAIRLKEEVILALKPFETKPDFAKSAKQYLLCWSLYNSMVFKDLTLRLLGRSGYLHLIRLLYDDYLIFLIEHQVALHSGQTLIAAMVENHRHNSTSWRDVIKPEECTEGSSLAIDVPVCVKREWDPTTPDPVPTKCFKISEHLE